MTTSQLYLLMSLNETLPIRMIRENVHTSEILMKAHLIVLKHRTTINEANYKVYSNLFETITRKSKKWFCSEKLIKFHGDAKKT